MELFDRKAFTLATIFIREAIYASLKRAYEGKGIISFFVNMFLPSIEDNMFRYNLKWFTTGLLSGILMSFWIPLIIYVSRTFMGLYFITLFVIAYLIMVMLISILIITDLIHQVIASINELMLWKRIEYLPISQSTIEKAASYSVLIGGGLSLLLGMGFAIGLIVYSSIDSLQALIMIPAGFVSSTLLVYPIMIIVYSKLGGRAPPLVSLFIHVAIVIAILTVYLNTLTFRSVDELLLFLRSYRMIYPFPYIYATVIGFDAVSIVFSAAYLTVGLALSLLIPSKYGIKLLSPTFKSHGKAFYLNFPRLLSSAFKDVLLLLRDSTRQKQFYGQLAALSTPFVLSLLSTQSLTILHGLEYVRSLVILSFYGILAYVSAVIVSPILLFIESDRNQIIYMLPINECELAISKTLASTMLYQPIPVILLLITSLTLSIVHGIIVFYSSNAYWIMASYMSYKLMLHFLWGKQGAWTEFSLGVLRRIMIMVLLLIPLAFYLPLVIALYTLTPAWAPPYAALALMIIVPLPIMVYILSYIFRD
ncbi:MAG: hypothetical protein B6U89_04745 [Desulfurococcales archaeon ex4484_58]|nr:MAG: hypothetical protein B6U89_04745 [Desulfurococcales archaeon ex4484_58]